MRKKVIDYNSALQNMYHNFIFYKSMRNGMGEIQCNADQSRIRTRPSQSLGMCTTNCEAMLRCGMKIADLNVHKSMHLLLQNI